MIPPDHKTTYKLITYSLLVTLAGLFACVEKQKIEPHAVAAPKAADATAQGGGFYLSLSFDDAPGLGVDEDADATVTFSNSSQGALKLLDDDLILDIVLPNAFGKDSAFDVKHERLRVLNGTLHWVITLDEFDSAFKDGKFVEGELISLFRQHMQKSNSDGSNKYLMADSQALAAISKAFYGKKAASEEAPEGNSANTIATLKETPVLNLRYHGEGEQDVKGWGTRLLDWAFSTDLDAYLGDEDIDRVAKSVATWLGVVKEQRGPDRAYEALSVVNMACMSGQKTGSIKLSDNERLLQAIAKFNPELAKTLVLEGSESPQSYIVNALTYGGSWTTLKLPKVAEETFANKITGQTAKILQSLGKSYTMLDEDGSPVHITMSPNERFIERWARVVDYINGQDFRTANALTATLIGFLEPALEFPTTDPKDVAEEALKIMDKTLANKPEVAKEFRRLAADTMTEMLNWSLENRGSDGAFSRTTARTRALAKAGASSHVTQKIEQHTTNMAVQNRYAKQGILKPQPSVKDLQLKPRTDPHKVVPAKQSGKNG